MRQFGSYWVLDQRIRVFQEHVRILVNQPTNQVREVNPRPLFPQRVEQQPEFGVTIVTVPKQNGERLVFRNDRRLADITLDRLKLFKCRNPGPAKHRRREFSLVSQREPVRPFQQSERQGTPPGLGARTEPVLGFDHIHQLIASQRPVQIDRDDRREIIQWLGKRETRNITGNITATQSNRQLPLDINDLFVRFRRRRARPPRHPIIRRTNHTNTLRPEQIGMLADRIGSRCKIGDMGPLLVGEGCPIQRSDPLAALIPDSEV